MQTGIQITPKDMQRLRRLVDGLKSSGGAESQNVISLEEELDRAQVVEAKDIKSDLVTLNSQVRVRDLDTGKISEYEVVYPNTKPRSSADGLSVLAPLGTALLGYRAGDVLEWEVPKGTRRIEVLEVLYQPEAANADMSAA